MSQSGLSAALSAPEWRRAAGVQQGHHFLVAGRREVAVGLADRVERARRGTGRPSRRRPIRPEARPPGPPAPPGPRRAAPRWRATSQATRAVDSGGDTVVHDDGDPATEVDARPAPAEALGAGLEHLALSFLHRVPAPGARPGPVDQPAVEDPVAPSPMAPIATSGWNGRPSFRTTMTSSGASSAAATSKARHPTAWQPQDDHVPARRRLRRFRGAASRRPASTRSAEH